MLSEKSILPGSSFDDYLIVPAYSEHRPAQVAINTRLAEGLLLDLPILAAAMDTISESAMGLAMGRAGGMAVIHKNMTPERQLEEVKVVTDAGFPVAAAVSVGEKEFARAQTIVDNSPISAIVVDTAHGHSKGVGDMVKTLRGRYPKLCIIAGNVATAAGALYLEECGASVVKVGIGPGSICTTRQVTGCGVPQLFAVYDAAKALDGRIAVIADGGIRESGDITKALAAGASAVMLGSVLAATRETPGDVIKVGDKKYKGYRGMGSIPAMTQGSKDRYGQGEIDDAKKLVPEGVEALVPYKGSVDDILYKMAGGLRSGMGMTGAKDLWALWEKAQFMKITPSAILESHVHSVQQISNKE
jgi:IMP dehydrogenase